jgi:hypothetical protein
MDAQQQLVWNGERSAAVLGKGADFRLTFRDGALKFARLKHRPGDGAANMKLPHKFDELPRLKRAGVTSR